MATAGNGIHRAAVRVTGAMARRKGEFRHVRASDCRNPHRPPSSAAGCARPSLAADTTVTLRNADGADVTTLTLSDAGNGVLSPVRCPTCRPAACASTSTPSASASRPSTAPAGTSTPTGKQHGILNEAGHHAGDMPNVVMPETGKGVIQIFAGRDAWSRARRQPPRRRRHGDRPPRRPDDYKTDPAGDSGDRIACGVIE